MWAPPASRVPSSPPPPWEDRHWTQRSLTPILFFFKGVEFCIRLNLGHGGVFELLKVSFGGKVTFGTTFLEAGGVVFSRLLSLPAPHSASGTGSTQGGSAGAAGC